MTTLANTHNRVLCSTLNVIERSLDEMINLLSNDEKITYELTDNLNLNKDKLLKKLNTLKEYINNFTVKYPIRKEKISFNKLLNSKKSIWAIYLEEIKSQQIKKKYSIDIVQIPDYDKDLNFIIDYIKSI
ncbi:MAG: hypothetical protein N2490_03995 [Ignavibacteria bacterium]|nr:hypothetical protein [Ignavibacteria bacterium]